MALRDALRRHPRLVLAVSGGVDSMTLAHAAHHVLGVDRVAVCHAVSPAVPDLATRRVQDHAARNGWRLHLLEAGEFADPNYLKNPVNRCYFCKSNLYDRIAASVAGSIASGANLDDLNDFRPGLKAADERRICHPFVEAGLRKADIRALARAFGLDDISELPAQPCLASRIETGLTVTPEDLAFVQQVETALDALAPRATLRCRVVAGGIRLELSPDLIADTGLHQRMSATARDLCDTAGRALLSVTPYQRGSAFLHG
ncbi:adenine nucleotide alpha hydrolase [Paracoccus tegillarcae]|uniref:Adenine nucleotide alpha hydrolase n=1 Tax=Paracoccus tegillarcae TaxID=1529068 RepID=A0A2K9F0L2_9RHOB|nr:adenine nucleotide alpha hydrolase [Paracoccus tegillarcae]